MLTRRLFRAWLGDGDGRSRARFLRGWPRGGGHARAEAQDSGGDFPARRGRRPERRGAVRREALLRTASHHRHCRARQHAGQPNGGHRPRRPLRRCIPPLQPLKPLWDKQQLAIVEATGSPDPSRSHFDAQDLHGVGHAGQAKSDGWLNRALPPPAPDTSPLRADRHGRAVAAHAARRPLRHRRERRCSSFSMTDGTASASSKACTRTRADKPLAARRQGRLRGDEDDRATRPRGTYTSRQTARSTRRAANWAAACSRSRG